MPLYETTCQVLLPTIEAIPFDVGSAYPFPRLKVVDGSAVEHDVRVIVLENEHLRVGILPDLGGRLVIPYDESLNLSIEHGGRRGSKMVGGVEFSLDGTERLNAMGPVDVKLLDDEEEPAVLLGEFATGEGVSWYLRVSLPTDRASALIEAKVFNRERLSRPYRGGFLTDEGVYLGAEPGVLQSGFRHGDISTLAPRQTDSWTCDLIPTSLRGNLKWSPHLLASWDGAILKVQALQDMPGHKVVLLSEGKSLETTTDLLNGKVTMFDVTGLSVQQIAVIGPEGPVFTWDFAAQNATTYEEGVMANDPAGFRRALTHADNRGASFIGLAQHAIRSQDFEAASSLLDDALGVNSEDPLAWWLKAALLRQLGQPNEAELLNAHFLAPFEPLLRAESYLASPSQDKSPSALLQPLMQDPDLAIEVAVQLHDSGLMDDLSKWVDECLRHREVPMLRYLLADALLSNSRMRTEAAAHVMAVAKAPINPPYPWRRVERDVLARLRRTFPDDARLEELSKGL